MTMELTHTHRTDQIRSDFELAAITIMGVQEDIGVDDMEKRYRGKPYYETAVLKTAAWLEAFHAGVKFKPHVCSGQGCLS